jgi:predicted Zn-dependent peptidase
VLVAIALAALLAGGTTASATEAGVAGYHHATLDNGLRVTVVSQPDNTVVATQLWYHVGSANEDPSSRGFAHLFEHLMFGGTENHDKEAYAAYHHERGGSENAYTSFDETVYHSTIGPEHLRGVLELEADRMVHLSLTEENLANEKRIVSEELRLRMENDPFARVEVATLRAALGDHPYAHTPGGTREDVAAATLEQAREFYEAYYRPKNAHLVIVGPVGGAETIEMVREVFGELPASGRTPPDVPPVLGHDAPDLVELEEDLPPVETVIYAYRLPPADADDRWAVKVLKTMLAGREIDPFEEILVARREKAVYAMTEFYAQRRGGALLFGAAFLPHRSQRKEFRYVDEAIAEIGRLDWLTEQSLAAAKRLMERRAYEQAYYPSGRAAAVGRAAWWQGDGRLAFDEPERIAAVTREDVEAVFVKYVAEAEPIRVYLEPERVPLWIRLFGWLYPLFR